LSKNIPIKEVPFALRPREKFKKYGVSCLDNFELLAILLGSGVEGKNVSEVSKSILKKYADKLVDVDYKELMKEKGIGEVKAIQLACAFELSKRFLNKDLTKPCIESPDDLESYLKFLKSEKKEHLVAFYLSPTNHLLAQETISIGTVDSNLIHPREIFAPALEHRATGVILAHNHPFGDSKPSNEDIDITKKIAEAGEVLGVKLIDHVLVGANDNFSFLSSHYKVKNDEPLYLRQGMVQKSLFDVYTKRVSLSNTSQQIVQETIDQDDWVNKTFLNPNATIRLGTLFSGIGAIEQAFKRLNLNHTIMFAGDIDANVKKSYFANYHFQHANWHDDITQFSAVKYKNKIDLLVGGSPCQAFSMVGKRLGLDDIRGTLFYDFARIVSETQPKVFIYENVKGLLNHDSGNTWRVVRDVFDDLGYKLNYQTMNSKDYGIPQNRERIIVVGFKDHSINFDFPKPIKLEHTMQDFLEDFIDSKYYLREKGIKFVTSSKNKNKRYTQINGDIALCQKANQQFNWHGDFVFEAAKENEFDEFIFDVNEVEEKYYLSDKVKNYVLAGGTKTFKTSTKTDLSVARPLLQTMHKMHRAGVDNYVTHNKGRIRKLTPRECLRLMGFRDDFKIEVSDTQMYRQAGNSIVVDVLIALLKQMDITKFSEH
jgi:DNA (cytosine-5)-methyltransferase 1